MQAEIIEMLREAKKNTHMTHIEDLTVLEGLSGVDRAIASFENLLDQFQGDTPKSELSVSVKIDGAPAVFAWSSFPGLDKPGISMKGLFAKTPKAATTHEEIVELFGYDNKGNYREDLVRKLSTLLNHIPKLGLPEGEIWQGDFLYDSESLEVKTIDGEEYISFHPNTLVYVVKADSEVAGNILDSEIGITWHTVYTGSDLESASAGYNADTSKLNYVPEIWSTDPYIKSLAGKVVFTAEQTDAIVDLLDACHQERDLLSVDSNYEQLIDDDSFITLFTQFQNYIIRKGGTYLVSSDFVEQFRDYGEEYLSNQKIKAIDKVKTDAGKQKASDRYDNLLADFDSNVDFYGETLETVSALIGGLTQLKTIFLNRLDSLSLFDAYLQKKEGAFSRTGQEGFAVSDVSGNVVKFVDRGQFSYANFSPDIVKGWENKRLTEALKIDPRIEKATGAKQTALQNLLPIIDKLSMKDEIAILNSEAKGTFLTITAIEAGSQDSTRTAFAEVIRDELNETDVYTATSSGDEVQVSDKQTGEKIITIGVKPASSAFVVDKGSTRTDVQEDIWGRYMYAYLQETEVKEDYLTEWPNWKNSWEEGSADCIEYLFKNGILNEVDRKDYVVCSSTNVHGLDSSRNLMNLVRGLPGKMYKTGVSGFPSHKTDIWNPSDLFIASKKAYEDMCDLFEEIPEKGLDVDLINNELKTLIDEQKLIGISLKMLAKNDKPVLHTYNLDQDEDHFGTLKAIEKINVYFGLVDSPKARTIDLLTVLEATDGSTNPVEIQLRPFNSKYPFGWSYEAKYKGKQAQLGKAAAGVFRNDFENHLKRSSYTVEEMLRMVTGTGEDPFVIGSELYETLLDTVRRVDSSSLKDYLELNDTSATNLVDAFNDVMTSYSETYGTLLANSEECANIKDLAKIISDISIEASRGTKSIAKGSVLSAEVRAIIMLQLIKLLDYLDLYATIAESEMSLETFFTRIVRSAAKIGDAAAPYVKLEGAK